MRRCLAKARVKLPNSAHHVVWRVFSFSAHPFSGGQVFRWAGCGWVSIDITRIGCETSGMEASIDCHALLRSCFVKSELEYLSSVPSFVRALTEVRNAFQFGRLCRLGENLLGASHRVTSRQSK